MCNLRLLVGPGAPGRVGQGNVGYFVLNKKNIIINQKILRMLLNMICRSPVSANNTEH